MTTTLLDLERQHKSLQYYIKHNKAETEADALLAQSEINNLLKSYYFELLSKDSIEWIQEVYPHNPNYPDFTVRHPLNGEIYYWEHFGMMDVPTYAQNAFTKLQLYTTHKIVPGIRLITTYETKENPLNSEIIEKVIEYYFGGM